MAEMILEAWLTVPNWSLIKSNLSAAHFPELPIFFRERELPGGPRAGCTVALWWLRAGARPSSDSVRARHLLCPGRDPASLVSWFLGARPQSSFGELWRGWKPPGARTAGDCDCHLTGLALDVRQRTPHTWSPGQLCVLAQKVL